MKKLYAIILSMAVVFSLAACDNGNKPDTGASVTDGTIAAETEPDAVESDNVDEAGIVSAHGQLRVEGTDIVDRDGKPYQLRGMSTHGIQWYPKFVNKSVVKELRDDWKTNVFRLAMYTGDGEGYSADSKEQVEQYVDDGIQICLELDMYCVIDWHILQDKTPQLKKEEAIAFFDKFSSKYGDKPNIIYEICNEPNPPATWKDDIKPYAEEIIPVIRKNDPDAIIIVGTAQWSQLIEEPLNDPLTGFENVMYTLHFYANTHKDWLRETLTRCHEAGLPVFVTEFGMCDASGKGKNNFEESEKWLNMLDEYNISYINWALADKNETVCVLNPGAYADGGWTEKDLSEGGKWIRDYFRSKG